jgi:hypothetical protein
MTRIHQRSLAIAAATSSRARYGQGLLSGEQSEMSSGGNGSPAGPREPHLDPADLLDEEDCQTSDFRRPKWGSVNRRRPRVRSDEPLGAPLH